MDGVQLGGSSCKTGMSRGDPTHIVAVQGLPPESTAKSIHDMFVRFGTPLVVHSIRFCQSAIVCFTNNVRGATQAMDAHSNHQTIRLDFVTEDVFNIIMREVEGRRRSRSPHRGAPRSRSPQRGGPPLDERDRQRHRSRSPGRRGGV